jgi:ADP-heptose:LPS heptosyltransferase
MKKFLIVRFSSIGDIVLTTPVVRCIKNQIADAEVHFLTKKKFIEIVNNNPNIEKVYGIEKNVSEVIGALKAENYDYIIDLHYNIRSILVKLKLKAKYVKFRKLNFKKWLLVSLKKNSLPDLHIVDRYLHPLKKLGIINDNKGLEFFIDKTNEIDVSKTLPAMHRAGYIGLVIGAAHFTKRLPREKLIQLCNTIDRPVVLLGGPEDAGLAEEIVKISGDKVYSACGKFNLQQSSSILKQAEQIITNDTGLMHIAAAFQKKIISVWGNTVPEFGMFPYYGKNAEPPASIIIEVLGLDCRPCTKLGFQKCPKGHFRCMNDIDTSKIIEAL